MKDLQTVLDALEYHVAQTRPIQSTTEAIAIVRQMMQAEPVAYEFRMRAESVVRWGIWSRCNKEQYEMYIRAPKLDDWVYETRALFAAPQAVPAWLPIESAPKDGTPIVVGYGRQSGFPVKVVFFNTVHKFWSHYGEADLGLPSNATHWMPLPAAPKGAV